MRFPKWQLRHIRKQYSSRCFANPRTLEASPFHSAPMSFAAPYIESEQVAAMLREKAAGKDYLVVDVRDDDFEGGNIPGALNIPSSTLLDRIPNLINDYSKVPTVVFHCAMSQVRGPKSARIYKEALLLNGIKTEQQVYVLRGGFDQWQARYKTDPKMIENYRPEFWNAEFDNVGGDAEDIITNW
ncbi:Rhodanese-like domain-containing protein [Endogone sp. FLAS-F59071]|nr:Rhodanese-like domain-containing protein [Endogone sp. FLAS-F59071]|eukprot:RUS14780.1 Rhodanese-like domain-containing protein [Endogone sp. FLAS-F59071]